MKVEEGDKDIGPKGIRDAIIIVTLIIGATFLGSFPTYCLVIGDFNQCGGRDGAIYMWIASIFCLILTICRLFSLLCQDNSVNSIV